jgi:hypothetical protein
MAAKEIKEKIYRVLDKMSDEVLEDVLKYLKSLTNKSKDEILFSRNLGRILEEDRNLLKRLSQ